MSPLDSRSRISSTDRERSDIQQNNTSAKHSHKSYDAAMPHFTPTKQTLLRQRGRYSAGRNAQDLCRLASGIEGTRADHAKRHHSPGAPVLPFAHGNKRSAKP